MRIITQLKLASTVTALALAVLVPLLLWSFLETRNEQKEYALADAIKASFFERTTFRDKYFLYREDQVRLQWEKSAQSDDEMLRSSIARFDEEEDRQLMERMRNALAESRIIFRRIVENASKLHSPAGNRHVYEELDRRLSSQLLMRSAAFREMATALKDNSAHRAEVAYRRLAIAMGAFALILSALTLLTATHLSSLIRRRLKPLHDGAEAVSAGNLEHRIPASGADEFAELAHAINTMTENLVAEIGAHQSLESALRNSEERLQAILNAAAVAIAWADETGRIEYMNPRFTSMFGYTMQDVPTVEQWNLHAYPDDAYRSKVVAEWNENVARSLPGRSRMEPMEVTVICKDGSARHTLLMGSWAGNRLLAIFSDITERKRAEQKLQKESEKNLMLLRNASDGIHILDINGNVVEASDSFCDMLGYTRDEVIGMNLAQWDAGLEDPERTRIFKQQFDSPRRSQFETRHRRKDGSVFDVEVSGFPLELDGKPVVFNSSRDITKRKLAEDQLARNEANLRAILDNVPYLVWLKDTDSRFIAVNKSFLRTTGHAAMDEVIGKTDFELWPEELARKYRDDDLDVMDRRLQKLTEEQSMNNGIVSWVETFKTPILDRNGKLLGTTGFSRDITERKHAQELVQHMAHYDTLTDLPNRVLFADRVQQALTAAKRDKCHLALMFIDLDKFKPINDELGHEVGDLLLKEVARRMQSCVRESDTVARIGGDEFVVLLPVIEARQDALHVAEKIRHALNQPFLLAGQKLAISSSTGVAVYPEHGISETQLMKSADVAMYHAKEGGRNGVVLYRLDMLNA